MALAIALQSIWHTFLAIVAALFLSPISVESLVLLSDLPTPCFVIDTEALRRIAAAPASSDESCGFFRPTIRLPFNGCLFRPYPINSEEIQDEKMIDVSFPVEEGQPSIGYVHTSVIRAREDVTSQDGPVATFLAEIDLYPSLCANEGDLSARLVLGLNNHHVGSYYWARSAGAGASMEAPGVSFGCNAFDNKKGVLRWLDEGGPIYCNSNDGKRSEWVNFLRKGDTVQLVPINGQVAMMQFHKRFGRNERGRIFGITAKGRPMGSEPHVICEWRKID